MNRIPLETTHRCPDCGGEAYLCYRHAHGAASWAIHCRDSIRHNVFSSDPISEQLRWRPVEGSSNE